MPPVKKETLYSEDYFLRFCARDEFDGLKLGKDASAEFLRAAEKDGLIVPLFVEKGKRKTEGGSEEEIDIRYYSPFQIFLVAAFINNDIDEGVLCSPDNKEWHKERGTRYIAWGTGSSSWVEHFAPKRNEEPQPMEHNIFSIADDFHKVAKLIHGLFPEDRFEYMNDNRRMFTGAPVLAYNLDPVREGKAAYIEQYDLNQNRLKRIIASVGSIATRMDPLERWFPYIQKHSRVRKDQLKGPAAIAQDLYDIGYDLMEIAYGEKLPQLLDLLHPDIKPYMMDRAEYASGEDIKAITAAFDKLQKWIKKNGDLIEDLKPAIEREKLDQAIVEIKTRIADYDKRYGDRRYVGSTRRRVAETMKLDELDIETRKWAENLFQQTVKIEEEREKVSEEDKALILAHEISFAIERGLDHLGRAVSDIPYKMAEATWPLDHKTKYEMEMTHMPALKEFGEKVPRTDPEYARKHHEFWSKGMKEYEKPYQDKLDRLDLARKELHGIGGQTRLVFCAACRKKPVRLRYGHTDDKITSEVVCDECLKKETKKIMVGTEEDRKKMKYAEWRCERCDAVLLKFALGNTIAVRTQNDTAIQVELDYGHVEMQARCPKPKCGHLNERPLDWGWIS